MKVAIIDDNSVDRFLIATLVKQIFKIRFKDVDLFDGSEEELINEIKDYNVVILDQNLEQNNLSVNDFEKIDKMNEFVVVTSGLCRNKKCTPKEDLVKLLEACYDSIGLNRKKK